MGTTTAQVPPELTDQLRKYQVDTTAFLQFYTIFHAESPEVALVSTAALLIVLRDRHHGMTIVLDMMRHSFAGDAAEWNIPDALQLIHTCRAALAASNVSTAVIVQPLAQELHTAVATFTEFLQQHYCKSRLPRKYLIVTWQLVVILRRKHPSTYNNSVEDHDVGDDDVTTTPTVMDPLAAAMAYMQHHVSRSTETTPLIDSINARILGPEKGFCIPNVYMATTAAPPELLDWACLAVDDTLFFVETMCDGRHQSLLIANNEKEDAAAQEKEQLQPRSKKARTIVPVVYGDAMELHEWVVRLSNASTIRPKGVLIEWLPVLLQPLLGNTQKTITLQPDGKIFVVEEPMSATATAATAAAGTEESATSTTGTTEQSAAPAPAPTKRATMRKLGPTCVLSDGTLLQMIVAVLHELLNRSQLPLEKERMRSYLAVATFIVHSATSATTLLWTNSKAIGPTTSLLERVWIATECPCPRAFLAVPILPHWPRTVRQALLAAHSAILESHLWNKTQWSDMYDRVIVSAATALRSQTADPVNWPPPVLQDSAAAGSVLGDASNNTPDDSPTIVVTWPAPCHNSIANQLLTTIVEPRVRDLLRVLQVVDIALSPVMGLIRYTLRHHIDFMWDRHVDHLILASIYGVGRSCGSKTLTFIHIMEGYVRCRQSVLGEASCQRMARQVRLDEDGETGSIITLYNKVFVPAVQEYLLDESNFTQCKHKL